MMKKFFLVFVLMFGYNIGKSQNWKPISAAISFKTKMLGATIEGRLSGFSGHIYFNPNDLTSVQFAGSVDAASIDTGNSLRNKHLKEKEEFFNVSKFPNLKMKSLRVEQDGVNYIGLFELTIKGIAKQVRIPFTFKQEGKTGVFNGQATINRKDWGLGGSVWGMSNEVLFFIRINTMQY
jgi:polyisoprenoid-binding protein YceI